jgi:hypothetical protein
MDLLQPGVGEESDGLAVRGPERIRGVIGPSQRRRFERIECANPDQRCGLKPYLAK